MHACIKVGDTPIFLPTAIARQAAFSGVTLTINATSDAEAEKLFAALGRAARCRCR